MLPSLIWVLLDRAVWPWDPAWYGEQSVNLWLQLSHSTRRWPGDMLRAFEIKAPGIAWLGQLFVPLGQLLGSIEIGLLLSIWLCQFATLILIWLFLRAWFPERTPVAVLGVMTAASAPLFVSMSHVYFAEALQLMATSWLFWLAAASPRMSRASLTPHLIAALSTGMLAKASAPLYFALPLGLVLLSWLKAKGWLASGQRPGRPGLFLGASLALCAACVGWYAMNYQALSRFVRSTSVGELAKLYGNERSLQQKLAFWLASFESCFFYSWAAIALGGIIVAGLVARLANRGPKLPDRERNPRSALLGAACLLQIAGVLAAVTLSRNEDQRYLLPVLPSVVGGLAWGIAALRSRLAVLLASLVMTAQFAGVNAQALRLVPVNPALTSWLHPYQPDSSQLDEVRRLAALATQDRREGRPWMIGVEVPWLNATSMSFLTVQQELRTHGSPLFTALGYAPTDFAATWNDLEAAQPPYFVSLQPERMLAQPDAFNLMARPVLERVAADACFEREEFASQLGLVVYRRTCTWP